MTQLRQLVAGIAMFSCATLSFAQGTFTRYVEPQINKDNPKYVEIFKKIHQNPELGFMEKDTSALIASELKKYGYSVQTGIGKTGVVGIIKNGDGPVVMYRADMDANPVKETTDLLYKSTKTVMSPDGIITPVAHACGHDAHVTWLLSSAKFMAENKNLWKGTLVMLAQPAEELIQGARAMVDDGLYTKYGVPQPDYLLGIHTAAMPTGFVAAASGVRMAGTDQIDVVFHGIGGHGSLPQDAKDPVIMATNAVGQYQQIISRGLDPQKATVLTVGSIQSGVDNNVIPYESKIKLNLRWFDENDRNTMIQGIQNINQGIVTAYGINNDPELKPTMTRKGWSYPLVNSEALTQTIRQGLVDNMPSMKLMLTEEEMSATTGSEDFHHLVINNPKKDYSYLLVGIAEPERFKKAYAAKKAPPFNNHSGSFEIDINAIPYGSKVATYGLLTAFNQNKPQAK